MQPRIEKFRKTLEDNPALSNSYSIEYIVAQVISTQEGKLFTNALWAALAQLLTLAYGMQISRTMEEKTCWERLAVKFREEPGTFSQKPEHSSAVSNLAFNKTAETHFTS